MKKKQIFALVMVILAVLWVNITQVKGQHVTPIQVEEITQLWQGSAHGLAEVNCSSCHQDKQTKEFIAVPDQESCRSCHESQVETFLLGKHGIRTGEGLSPLTPKMAHLPMKETAFDKQMSCNTCHDVHSVNTFTASVDSCLTCHNDTHSLNYENSRHAQLFAAEGTLPRPSEVSVTCATCHLPRQEVDNFVHVNHNNTYTLLPRDRMVKEICMNCHSVEYSYNSIFDDELVEENFARSPTLELETFDLIRALEKKRLSKAD